MITFDDFWRSYPRKVGKGAAQKSWDKCVDRMKISPSVILDGAKRYAAAKTGSDIQYVAHPSTWLNQQRWLDEDGAPEPDAGPHRVDNAALDCLEKNRVAREIRDRLVVATRTAHADRIAEAARRLGATESELWSCMTPGWDGIHFRAWDAAVAEVFKGEPRVPALTIEKTHWLSAKDRFETRAGIAREKNKKMFTSVGNSDIDEPVHSKREMDDDDYSAASAGMA